MDALRQSEPDRPLPLHERAERAIVDQRAAQRLEPAGRGEGFAPHQHAAAGCRCSAPAGIVHPRERIEHLEEEDEGRNEPSLGCAFAAKLHHQRGKDALSRAGDRNEPRKHMGRVGDVGVAEQHEFGRRRAASIAERPWRIAHSFPVQPGARLVPATICSRSAAPAALAAANAAAAVPSALWSSTTTTENGPR